MYNNKGNKNNKNKMMINNRINTIKIIIKMEMDTKKTSRNNTREINSRTKINNNMNSSKMKKKNKLDYNSNRMNMMKM